MRSKHPLFRILRIAREAQAEKKKMLKKWQRWADQQGKISCKQCTKPFCCNQFVSAHIFEGTLIAWSIMQRNDKKLMKAIIDQGRRQGKMMADGGCVGIPKQEDLDKVTSAWFDLQEPCALLRNGRCDFYALRPTACASYCVLTPPADCGPPSGGDVLAVNGSGAIQAAIMIDAKFLSKLIDFGDDIPVIAPLPLGLAVLYGVALLTEGPDALLEYMKQERPYAEMED